MKKQLLLIVLAIFSQTIFLQGQTVTKLVPADLKGFIAKAMEIVISQSGSQLNASNYTVPGDCCDSIGLISVKIGFKGNARDEFGQFAGVVSAGKLQLEMVNEKTGKNFPSTLGPNGFYQFATHETGHYYRFVLNGKVIATGYKPRD